VFCCRVSVLVYSNSLYAPAAPVVSPLSSRRTLQEYTPKSLYALKPPSFPLLHWYYKDVDIFSKDYLIVPVHEALHWSLAVVCHPGADPADPGLGAARRRRKVPPPDDSQLDEDGNAEEEEEGLRDLRARPRAEPLIIHLDSMSGGHGSDSVANTLRRYLRCEWEAQVRALTLCVCLSLLSLPFYWSFLRVVD
jgi:hypothetical protein